MKVARIASALCFSALGALSPTRAWAGDCAALNGPVYGLGGSATKPILAKVSQALAVAGDPTTIVYQAPGACVGINGLLSGTTKLTGTASYWDAAGKEQSCTLPFDGVPIGFANMGNSASLCPGVGTLPSDIGDFVGSVQSFDLIVPKASSQLSISAEAVYFVFGFGAAGGVSPWVDESQLFRRDANSAAQLFIALAAGLPPDRFVGIDTKSNAGTATAVAQSVKPEAALGLVSGEVADAYRDTVRTLAYQHRGQSCGYWPDSTPTAFDKRNVRTGQYHIWSPIHFFARVNPSGVIADAGVKKVIGYFTGEQAAPAGVDLLAAQIKASTVPKCAMEVWRTEDLGELQSYAAPEPCGCFFDAIATGSTTCSACSSDDACSASAPHCRHGYCEVN